MRKLILACLLVILPYSCDPPPEMKENRVTGIHKTDLKNIEGLADCNLFFLRRFVSADLYVVRCPNSSTTTKYTCGKNCQQNITTIDETEPD